MTSAASRTVSALLSLALILGFGWLVWTAVGEPARNWRDAALDRRASAIAERDRLVRSIAMLKAEQARLSGNGALDMLWTAAQTGTATALIQSEISRIAVELGVSLRSISPLSQRDLSLADAAGFRLELEARLDALSAFLQQIEYHSPALLVDRAVLRRLNKPGDGQEQPLVFAQIELVAPIVLTGGETGQ